MRQATAAAVSQARLSGDALMTRLIAKTLPSMPAPDSGFAAPPPPPERVAQAADIPARPRRLPRSVAVLALMVSGGFLWQTFLSLSARDVSPLRVARPAAAEAGLATLAEQAVAQSPTGAGPAMPAASASLSSASGPRSSPPVR